MKLIVMTLYVLILIAVAGVFYVVGVGNQKPILVMEFDTDILDMAIEYHGINEDEIKYVSGDDVISGSFYFERDDTRCSLLNNGFRNWYAENWLNNEED